MMKDERKLAEINARKVWGWMRENDMNPEEFSAKRCRFELFLIGFIGWFYCRETRKLKKPTSEYAFRHCLRSIQNYDVNAGWHPTQETIEKYGLNAKPICPDFHFQYTL